MRNALELLLVYAFFAPLAFLPRGLSQKAGKYLGLFFYHVLRGRRRIALENLDSLLKRGGLSLSEKPRAVVKRAFMNLGRSISEMAKVYFGLGKAVTDRIEVEGLEHFKEASSRGNGVIFTTGHCGNWELWGLTIPTWVGRAWGVARKQKNPYLNAIIERTRQKYGGVVVYKEGALKTFISALREGGTVGIVMDEAVRPSNGVEVEFLGAPRYVTKMTVSLARRTSATVLPVFMHRKNGGHIIRIHPEVRLTGDDAADTALIVGHIEDYIRKNPSDWLLLLRRWKKKRRKKRKKRPAPEAADAA